MTFKIKVLGTDKEFLAENNENILNAALRQNIVLPYGCKNGGCGTCKGKIKDGIYTSNDNLLTENEREQGFALLCSTVAMSDLSIEAKILEQINGINIKKLVSRITSIDKVNDNIIILKIQLPINQQFEFLPGQYIDILLKNGNRRSYSIASNPFEQSIELHIRHMEGGLFTDSLFGFNKEIPVNVKDILRLEGPLGSFFIRQDEKPIIFLASGTGYAPIKSMINNLINHDINKNIVFYWGVRNVQDLYDIKQCEIWQNTLTNFKFVPVISESTSNIKWEGRTGLVHQAVLQDIQNMQNYNVYACGAPIMVESARKDFISKAHLPQESFFADAFLSRADLSN